MGSGDPEGQKCDWCSDPATNSFEIRQRVKGRAGATMGTSQFWFTCDSHVEQGKKMTAEPKPATRRR